MVASLLLAPLVAVLVTFGKVRAGAGPFDILVADHRAILSLLDFESCGVN